jgi:hypothetical protein
LRIKGVVVLLATLAVGACGYQHRPVYNVDDPVPRWDQDLSSQRLEDQIVAACYTLGWKTQHVADGHLTAVQSREKFSATVDILFDRDHWQIRYNSSVGLNADGETIHDHYNLWVRNLEREIQRRLGSTLPPVGQ